MFQTTEEGSAIEPIHRIVFIPSESAFPTIGNEDVVYIYNNDIYV